MRTRRQSLVSLALALASCLALLGVRNLLVVADVEALGPASEEGERGGSWHFPRGGPYVLGFEASGEATLYVDGKLVAKGSGIKKKRMVFEAGDYPLRLISRGDVRLLWHPPGRRGPLEYVPASSLSKESESPSFSGPGRSVLDGTVALALLLVWLGWLLYLFWPALKQGDRILQYWMLAVFVVSVAVRLWGLDAAGQTWDEDVNWSAGRNYITNLLGFDFSKSSWSWNYEHPPVMKYIAGIGAQFQDGYTVSRAFSVLWVSLAALLMVPIGARLGSLRVGVLAGALTALTPHLIAHSKVVGHEAPTLFFWALAVWLCLRAHDPGESDGDDDYRLHKRFAVIGVVLGLALASRFVNGLLAPLIGLLLLVQAPRGERKRTVILGLAIIPAAALLTFVAVWPRMWTHPIANLQESWDKLKKPHDLEPYLGEMSNEPPRSYFLVYLWATAPAGLLLFSKLFVLRAGLLRERAALVVLVWFLVPLGVMVSPVRQDGVRYVMPCLLAMNMAAALSVDHLASTLERRVGPRRLYAVISGLLTLYLLISCWRIHPFYLDYYGEQVGGPARVADKKNFEIAWWGEGMNQALDYLNEHAEPGARVYKRCFEPGHLAWMRGDLWPREARRPQDAEWFLVYQPSVRSCPIPKEAELMFEARAQGAPLARVYYRSLP